MLSAVCYVLFVLWSVLCVLCPVVFDLCALYVVMRVLFSCCVFVACVLRAW